MWTAVAICMVLYLLFICWYKGLRGKLTSKEIDGFLRKLENSGTASASELADIRAFLEADDGKEFYMLNHITLHEGTLRDPDTGADTTAEELLKKYSKPFMKELFLRGGHPMFQVMRVGPNVDTWNNTDEVAFPLVSMMRYRSRRDLAELATMEKFEGIHQFKLGSIHRTVSYPVHFRVSLVMRPPCVVFLLLVLACVMLQYLL